MKTFNAIILFLHLIFVGVFSCLDLFLFTEKDVFPVFIFSYVTVILTVSLVVIIMELCYEKNI